MIVDNRMPFVVIVTILALRSEAARVRVVGSVTTVAILGDFVLVVAAAMASEAVDVGMHAKQCITGLLQVIVLGSLPFLGGVAFGAVRTAGTAVFIVGGMAADAALRCHLVAPADVTGIAGDRQVRAGQTEFSFVVIEFAARPAQGAVAFAAGLRELTAVHIVRLMA